MVFLRDKLKISSAYRLGLEHRVTTLRNTFKNLPTTEAKYEEWRKAVGGSTKMIPALELAAQMFVDKSPQRRVPRRTLILLSDGQASDK